MTKKKKSKPWLFPISLVFGAIIGYCIGYLLKPAETAVSSADKPNLFFIIATILIGSFLAILIHEIGHVIGGMLMGNEFSMLVVGPFKFQKEDGQYSLTFNQDISVAGGFALTLPTQVEGFKKRRLVTIGSGPLASLLLAIGGFLLWHYLEDGPASNLRYFSGILGFFSALVFVATIIPMKAGGMMSDGMQLLLTLRNDEKAKRYANFMQLFAMNNKGIEPKDLPIELFGNCANQPITDIYDFAFHQYLYYQAINENQLEQAAVYIKKMEEQIDIYPPNFQSEVIAEWVVFYGLIQPNPTEFERFYAEMEGKKPLMSKVNLNMYEAAVAAAKGQMEIATEFGQKVLNTKKLDGTTKMYQKIIKATLG